MGRRSEPEPLIEPLQASELARERLRIVLLTLAGQWSVKDAMARLSISRTRFQDLRRRMLEGAVAALEVGPMGRPAAPRRDEDDQTTHLRRRIVELEHEIKLVRTSLDLARSPVSGSVQHRLRSALLRKRRRKP